MNLMLYHYHDNLFIAFFIIQSIVFVTWTCFLIYSIKLIKNVPKLSSSKKSRKNSCSYMVSIILPARNEEKYIRKCLDSLVKQEYPNYEIVVINDCSSDNTSHIIKEYVNKTNCKIISIDTKPRPPSMDWKKLGMLSRLSTFPWRSFSFYRCGYYSFSLNSFFSCQLSIV